MSTNKIHPRLINFSNLSRNNSPHYTSSGNTNPCAIQPSTKSFYFFCESMLALIKIKTKFLGSIGYQQPPIIKSAKQFKHSSLHD